jgi:hypothetical protein
LPDGFQWISHGSSNRQSSVAWSRSEPAELTLNTDEFLIEVFDPNADRPVPSGWPAS